MYVDEQIRLKEAKYWDKCIVLFNQIRAGNLILLYVSFISTYL